MKTNRTNKKNIGFESMEKRELFAADLGLDLATDGMIGPETQGDAPPAEYTSGENENAAYYNKIAFQYLSTTDGREFKNSDNMEWDNVKNVAWEDDSSDSVEAAPTSFVADSFSFGVEREMKESGEKGGTADINIGVGELQECTVSKSMDSASVDLVFSR